MRTLVEAMRAAHQAMANAGARPLAGFAQPTYDFVTMKASPLWSAYLRTVEEIWDRSDADCDFNYVQRPEGPRMVPTPKRK